MGHLQVGSVCIYNDFLWEDVCKVRPLGDSSAM